MRPHCLTSTWSSGSGAGPSPTRTSQYSMPPALEKLLQLGRSKGVFAARAGLALRTSAEASRPVEVRKRKGVSAPRLRGLSLCMHDVRSFQRTWKNEILRGTYLSLCIPLLCTADQVRRSLPMACTLGTQAH